MATDQAANAITTPLSLINERLMQFLRDFIAGNGYPPTFDEIRVALSISSKSLVQYHLIQLAEAGYIERQFNTARSIRLLK